MLQLNVVKSTHITALLVVIVVIAGGIVISNQLASNSYDQQTPPSFKEQAQQSSAIAAQKDETQTHKKSADTEATSADTTKKPGKQLLGVSPQEATHIEVIEGCNHNYEGGCLNARSGPSTSSPVVSQLRNNIVLKVAETKRTNNRTWYRTEFAEWLRYPDRVSDDWWVAGDFVRPLRVTATSTDNPKASNTEKRIVVDLSEQQLYAYQGDSLFMKESVSTGKQLYPTPRGTFSIYKKTPTRYMQGPIPNITDQKYDLPGVPWDLYFTYQGAVIHGTYWHNNFGRPWSNGCVNLPPAEAEKLYKWAELGTPVTVRD